MNTGFEELVRDSMEWFTEDLQVPADLAGQARRAHQRRRRLAGTAVVALGTAAVTAAAVIAATVPGTGGVTNAQTTAYVIKRVQNALAAENFVIQGAGDVDHDRLGSRPPGQQQQRAEHELELRRPEPVCGVHRE